MSRGGFRGSSLSNGAGYYRAQCAVPRIGAEPGDILRCDEEGAHLVRPVDLADFAGIEPFALRLADDLSCTVPSRRSHLQLL